MSGLVVPPSATIAKNRENAAQEREEQFDKEAPCYGWGVTLNRNAILGELVGQLPQSSVIQIVQKSNARSDKEYHLIVHAISQHVDEQYKALNLEPGDRVVISGHATNCFVNGVMMCIVPLNAIQARLFRLDGAKYVGSKYGPDALKAKDGTASEAGAAAAG